jgi:hypothetical protein
MPDNNPYDLSKRRPDEEIRAGLRARRNVPDPEVEDMARRVQEAMTLTAEDWATIINT